MMVPRGFLRAPAVFNVTEQLDEKRSRRPSTRPERQTSRQRQDVSPSQMLLRTISDPTKASSPPVKIPVRRGTRTDIARNQTLTSSRAESRPDRNSSVFPEDIPRSHSIVGRSVETLLAATEIPPRRKRRTRKVQRLRDCDHVGYFSKLLLEDVWNRDNVTTVGNLVNPQLECLCGNLDEVLENGNVAASQKGDCSLLSVRSVSSDSMPSLAYTDDTPSTSYNDATSPSSLSKISPPDRRFRQLSSSEDCSHEHPLLQHNIFMTLEAADLKPDRLEGPQLTSPKETKSRSSLRSNLTASLRAIKSAAQSVSALALNPPILQPDDFLTKSVFSFNPGSTDDKRPPPTHSPPSAALRRYLNPPPTPSDQHSPSDFHFWHDFPANKPQKPSKKRTREKGAVSKTSAAIQLQTCIPSPVRSAHASSPPIWLNPDGTPLSTTISNASFIAGPNLMREREPRENSAFLRILVAEMNMRRSGKFADAMVSHAFVWLPARKTSEKPSLVGMDRWEVLTRDG